MENKSIFSRIVERIFGKEINNRVNMAVKALDDPRDKAILGYQSEIDRREYDRTEIETDALKAWRENPIAKRIVSMTTQFVVGKGVKIETEHEITSKFIRKWWDHRLNNMSIRVHEWCDELTRSGNLFIVISTDAAGMSYMRAFPSSQMLEIQTAANDIDQEIAYYLKPAGDDTDTVGPDGQLRGKRFPAYDENKDRVTSKGTFKTIMLHYAVNKPVGGLWGESDLAPLLRWLARYSAWLEDRVRLNRFRNIFLFWVKAKFANKGEMMERQAELNANPPNPGSILVSDYDEEWSTLYPNLASFEAAEDGLAIKKILAVGSGNPLHYLAEPESATRTTAESSGLPTYRNYEQRQEFFLFVLEDIAGIVVNRRAMIDRHISKTADITAKGTDISARDNAALATAANTITSSFGDLRNRGLIDDAELLRIAYRFAGEVVDIEQMLERGKEAPPIPEQKPKPAPNAPGGGSKDIKVQPVKVSPVTGMPTNIEKTG
jgi:hypothetical protein